MALAWHKYINIVQIVWATSQLVCISHLRMKFIKISFVPLSNNGRAHTKLCHTILINIFTSFLCKTHSCRAIQFDFIQNPFYERRFALTLELPRIRMSSVRFGEFLVEMKPLPDNFFNSSLTKSTIIFVKPRAQNRMKNIAICCWWIRMPYHVRRYFT